MSDTTVDVADTTTDAGAEPAVESTEPDSDKPDSLGEPGLKALQAERDARAKAERDMAALQKKLKAFEDRDKSEIEKASERTAELTAELDARNATIASLEHSLMRNQVAFEKGLPADLAARLQGDDRKALEKDADALLALVGKKSDPRQPKPVEKLGGDRVNLSPAEQFAALMETNL